MKIVCAWCGKVIRESVSSNVPGKDGEQEPISHGICPTCKKRVLDTKNN